MAKSFTKIEEVKKSIKELMAEQAALIDFNDSLKKEIEEVTIERDKVARNAQNISRQAEAVLKEANADALKTKRSSKELLDWAHKKKKEAEELVTKAVTTMEVAQSEWDNAVKREISTSVIKEKLESREGLIKEKEESLSLSLADFKESKKNFEGQKKNLVSLQALLVKAKYELDAGIDELRTSKVKFDIEKDEFYKSSQKTNKTKDGQSKELSLRGKQVKEAENKLLERELGLVELEDQLNKKKESLEVKNTQLDAELEEARIKIGLADQKERRYILEQKGVKIDG